VRSLPPTATNEALANFFSQHFPVVRATVVIDPNTKASRGYGFVTFTDADDAVEAKEKLQNELLDGRRLRLDIAEPRHRASTNGGSDQPPSRVSEEKKQREQSRAEALKPPKLIVRNLPWSIKTPQDLAAHFRMYGKIKYIDLPQSNGKLAGFGFVTLRGRTNAERAIAGVNGKIVDERELAVDWAVDKETWQKQLKSAETEAETERPPTSKTPNAADVKASSKVDPGDEDEPMDDDDADLRNFMKNHMENLEDEDGNSESGAEDDDQWEDEEEGEKAESTADTAGKEKRALSTDNSTTVFVRNLPFTTTDEELKAHFVQHFGPIRFARVVMDKSTDRPAGTGFVCFFDAENLKTCLKGSPRQKPLSAAGKRSVLQNDAVDPEGKYTLDGRVLQVAQAVSKEEATRLTSEGSAARMGQDKDKRRLFLLGEGTIPKNSPLYASLPPADIKMREASAQQRKKLVQGNPSLHISLTRLAVRNIPRNIDSKALKALAREAVVGFAKDVKEGRRQPLSKEENARGGQQDKEAEHLRKKKGKGVVKQSKVVFETKEGTKVAEDMGASKSRGYGFIEYSSHRWALMGLRWLNGHELKNEAGKTSRLIVEFAIENANVVARRRTNEDRSRKNERLPSKGKVGLIKGRDAASGPSRKGPPKKDSKAPKANGSNTRGKGKERGREKSEETASKDEPETKKSKMDSKLAMRQQIIGRKRLMRKKKGQARQGK